MAFNFSGLPFAGKSIEMASNILSCGTVSGGKSKLAAALSAIRK